MTITTMASTATSTLPKKPISEALFTLSLNVSNLEDTIIRLGETFQPVLNFPPKPDSKEPESMRKCSSEVTNQVFEISDRIEQARARLQEICDASEV